VPRLHLRLPKLRTCALLFVSWCVIPLFALVAVELMLRAAGYGRSTKPFQIARIDGNEYAAVNMNFFEQFIPMWPNRLRTEPYDVVIPVRKSTNTYRVAVFGGSAALGYLTPEFGFWRHLYTVLEAKYPDANIEVYCLAWNGMNSHVMRLMAQACTFLDFDLFVVYMGNNEFKGTLALIYDLDSPWSKPMLVNVYAYLSNLRLVQLVSKGRAVWAGRPDTLQDWIAHAACSSLQDPRLESVYRAYEYNVERICEAARRSGTTVLLCSVASNLRSWPPTGSEHAPEMTGEATQAWDAHFEAGKTHEAAQEYAEAVAAYERAASIDDEFAELQFRLGTCKWALGRYEEAGEHFRLAHEQDLALIRANGRINSILRDIALRRKDDGVLFADTVAALADASPHGVPGEEMFDDFVHLTFEGNYHLARAVYERIGPEMPEWLKPLRVGGDAAPSIEECRRRMAMTAVEDRSLVENSQSLAGFQQSRQLQVRLQDMKTALDHELEGKDAHRMTAQACKAALAINPDEYFVRRRYIQSLITFADSPTVEGEAQTVLDLYPHQWGARYDFIRALERAGKSEEARRQATALTEIFPFHAESYFALGELLVRGQFYEDALAAYRKAASLKRVNDLARVAEATVLEELGDTDGAIRAFTSAAAVGPESPTVYTQLDEALRKYRTPPDRIAVWTEVARAQPRVFAPAFRLAQACEEAGQFIEAVAAFRKSVGLQPDLDARLGLARCLIQAKDSNGAIPVLRDILKAQPGQEEASVLLISALQQSGDIEAAHEEARNFQASGGKLPQSLQEQLSGVAEAGT